MRCYKQAAHSLFASTIALFLKKEASNQLDSEKCLKPLLVNEVNGQSVVCSIRKVTFVKLQQKEHDGAVFLSCSYFINASTL
ncbi:MAG: hypothetical protein ACRCZZ_10800 [Phocaeicola sp.]